MNWTAKGNRKPWIFPTIDQSQKVVLHIKNDKVAILHLSIRVLTHAILFYFAHMNYSHHNFIYTSILILMNGALWNFSGWAGLGHELFHKSVFSHPKINVILCKIFAVINWNNYYYFNYSHTLHHVNTMYSNDPEAPSDEGLRLKQMLSLILISPIYVLRRVRITLLNSLGIIPNEFGRFLKKDKTKVKKIKMFARYILIFQVTSLVLFISMNEYLFILLINLAPFFCKLPNRVLEIVQHFGMKRNVNDFRLNTRSVEINSIIKLFYGNMNYHLEHHLFPKLPYYNMGLARQVLKDKKFIKDVKIKGFREILKVIYDK